MIPTVLLVEDEPALLETIKEYLEPRYNVTAVGTAKDAFAALKERHFKILVVDLGLPDMDGSNIIKFVAKEHRGSTILALTANQTSEAVKSAVDAGVHGYLVKPIDSVQLHQRIEKILLKRSFSR